MLINFYPVSTTDQLKNFFDSYVPFVMNQLRIFNINPKDFDLMADHLGLQVLSRQEFDKCHSLISKYSQIIKQGIIHDRRNNTYKLNKFIKSQGMELQSIEMFEPKPDADTSKLKPGFEHISIKTSKYNQLKQHFLNNGLPIDKEVEFGGSRFFKTKLVNMVEIEFREDYLWQDLLREQEELL